MSKISIYNLEGKAVSQKNLSADIFSVSANPAVIYQAVSYQLANRRASIAHTKTRAEVSGGGRKPFKQKGTGNARAGSTRSPLWIGGGITFGPRNTANFCKRIPKKIKTLALKAILSEKVKNKKIIVLADFKLPKISTSQIYEIFSKLPINEGRILVILPQLEVNTELSLANIPYAKIIKTENLNVLDLLKYDFLLTTDDGLEKIEKIFSKKNNIAKVAK